MKLKTKLKAPEDMTANGIMIRWKRSMSAAAGKFRKWGVKVIALFLGFFLAFCVFHCIGNLHSASTILSLDYEEASKGLTPNGMRFNVFEIRSPEVMKRLIDYADLDGKVTPDELSECVSVKATHDKNISGNVNYISTSFKNISGNVNYISTSFVVRFTNKGFISGTSAKKMLALLCKAYSEYFVEHYGFNHTILSFDTDDLKFNDEYLMAVVAVDLLDLKCRQLEKYVDLRSRESKNYQDPDTGMTFSSLKERLNDFYTYDLAKLRSYIIENGIAKDKAGMISMLDYKIRMDRLMNNKMMAAYYEDNKGIKMYDAAMSAVVMIPTQDEQMQYYMSRTKTGMDNMVKHAQEQLTGTAEHMEHIEYNTYLTEKLEAGTAGKKMMKKADTMISEMEVSLDKIASDIQTVDSGYLNTKARNYISISSDSTGFAEQIGLVSSMLGAALMLIVTFIVVALRIFFSDKEMTA